MFTTLVLICLIGVINCGSDLCKNGGKIDSITYIDGKKMWFFTSGGNYWYLKAEDFPPKVPGKPLPGGFKKGEAAIYRNTLEACSGVQSDKPKPQEQEIHLMEFINGENKILVFDTRTNEWVNADTPTPYNKDKGLGQAKIDWTAPIDSAFIYKKTNIVVIQGKRYSIVDITNVCKDPNGWGEGKQSRATLDLNVQSAVDATAAFDDRYFYLFQDQVFWKVEITSYKSSEGKLTTIKNMQQDVVTEFFKFQENCKLPATEATETTVKPLEGGPIGEEASQPPEESETQQPSEDNSEATEAPVVAGGEETQTKEEKDDSGGFPWIIVIIIVIIVVLIAIVLIACLAMRKGKGKDPEAAQNVAPAASAMGSSTGTSSRGKSNLGTSPSTMSVRSNTGLGGAKGGSKTGKAKAMSSTLGSSPSTMSVRSNAGLTTSSSKISSKTGSKK